MNLIIIFFKKYMGQTALFFVNFRPFKQTIQILQQINVKICHVHPVSGAGIWTHDLWNVSESPPTRPGLPPFDNQICHCPDNQPNLTTHKSWSTLPNLTWQPTYALCQLTGSNWGKDQSSEKGILVDRTEYLPALTLTINREESFSILSSDEQIFIVAFVASKASKVGNDMPSSSPSS